MSESDAPQSAPPPHTAHADVALRKLARTLGVPVERLDYLADVPSPEITEFHRGIADVLFEDIAAGMRRVATATQVIPAPIAAKLSTRNGPVFTAHLAAMVEPARAIGVAKRLPAEFLTEVATHLDLRRSAAVIAGLPRKLLVAVARRLADRQDWLTLATVMAATPDDALAAWLATFDTTAIRNLTRMIDDDREMARVAAMVAEPLATEIRTMLIPHGGRDE